MDTWQIKQAKARFDEVVDNAVDHGPQVITRDGAEIAVVLSYDEYRKLHRPTKNLVDFFACSPLRDDALDFERAQDTGRDIGL